MPRAPIGKRAMTPAERQQKRRKRRNRLKRLKKEKLALGRKAERQRQLLKAADDYLPTPPGITYWRKVAVVTPQGERDVWSPKSRPLPSIEMHALDDGNLVNLIDALLAEARRRGISLPCSTAASTAKATPAPMPS